MRSIVKHIVKCNFMKLRLYSTDDKNFFVALTQHVVHENLSESLKLNKFLEEKRAEATLESSQAMLRIKFDDTKISFDEQVNLESSDANVQNEVIKKLPSNEVIEEYMSNDSIVINRIMDNSGMDSVNELRNKISTINLDDLKTIPTEVSTVAPLVDKSQTLTNLLRLGVNIAEIESIKGGPNLLARLDWERHVVPVTNMLKQEAAFTDKQIAIIYSKYPKIFRKNMVDVHNTFQCLRDRRLSQEEIAEIVSKEPAVLRLTKESICQKLEELQNLLLTSNREMNAIIVKCPVILWRQTGKLKDNLVTVKKMIGFTSKELKFMVLMEPSLMVVDKATISANFIFLHRSLNLSYEAIAECPSALVVTNSVLTHRSKYLIFLSRLQTDPTRELYSPYSAIVTGSDQEFCRDVAHTSMEQYHKFLRTL